MDKSKKNQALQRRIPKPPVPQREKRWVPGIELVDIKESLN